MKKILILLIVLMVITTASSLAKSTAVPYPNAPTERNPNPDEQTEGPVTVTANQDAKAIIKDDGRRKRAKLDVAKDPVMVKSRYSSFERIRLNGKKYYVQYVGRNLLGGHVIRITTTTKKSELNRKTVILKSGATRGRFILDNYKIDYKIKERGKNTTYIYFDEAKKL
jgi:hypothetical protein